VLEGNHEGGQRDQREPRGGRRPARRSELINVVAVDLDQQGAVTPNTTGDPVRPDGAG